MIFFFFIAIHIFEDKQADNLFDGCTRDGGSLIYKFIKAAFKKKKKGGFSKIFYWVLSKAVESVKYPRDNTQKAMIDQKARDAELLPHLN